MTRLVLVVALMCAPLLPAPAFADAGFSPGVQGTTGSSAGFSWWAWLPTCQSGKGAGLEPLPPLDQDAYRSLVEARATGVRLRFSATGCDVAVGPVLVVPKPGESWGTALYRMKRGGWRSGIDLEPLSPEWLRELVGAEHTGTTRQALAELCAIGHFRGDDCRPSDYEITYAGGSAARPQDLPGATWLRILGNGSPERSSCAPHLAPGETETLPSVWGVPYYLRGCAEPTRPKPAPTDAASCNRPPSCNCVMLAVNRADLPAGIVMIRGLFGVESAHCNLFGWPPAEPAREEPMPSSKCTWPGHVARVELIKPGSSLPCCGDGGAIDLAQELLLQAYDVLGQTECPGGGNPNECCAAIEAGQAGILEALAKMGSPGCDDAP